MELEDASDSLRFTISPEQETLTTTTTTTASEDATKNDGSTTEDLTGAGREEVNGVSLTLEPHQLVVQNHHPVDDDENDDALQDMDMVHSNSTSNVILSSNSQYVNNKPTRCATVPSLGMLAAAPPLSANASATATPASFSPLRVPHKQIFFIKASESPSSERSRHVQSTKRVTRDIAALDFLQNIPMKSEQQASLGGMKRNASVVAPDSLWKNFMVNGTSSVSNSAVATPEDPDNPTVRSKPSSHHLTGGKYHASAPSILVGDDLQPLMSTDNGNDEVLSEVSQEMMSLHMNEAGRRLPGCEATMINIPDVFRYRFCTKISAASAVVRRWESHSIQQGLLESRMFYSSDCGYPIAVSTVIKYNCNETKELTRKRLVSVGNLESISYDWRGKSYYRLLHSTWADCDKDRDSEDSHPVATPYMPNYLDDPEFRQGRHRHVVRGDKNIGPVICSIILFVKPNELKEELNKKFREKHTWLDNELSLSKIRNLKRETLASCQRLDLEIATAALACVYFEKLVLNQCVNKANRKLYMAACFLLAAKFNEPQASECMKTTIKNILVEIDHVHSIPSREVLQAEFTVYAQLSFGLHVQLYEVQPHFTRLLKCVESNPRKYLDEDVFTTYSKLVMEEKNTIEAALTRSFDETMDEGTESEVPLTDEEEEELLEGDDSEQEGGASSRANRDELSVFPWHRVSFSQWWKERKERARVRGS